MSSSIANHHIQLILDIDKNIIIIGYPNELIQCFINIFNNAKDAFLENKLENKFIFITSFIKKQNLIITIKDNAGGISQKILPKIFEPYFTTKHQSKGTGLGLHMTYNFIVEGMNGTIEANNVHYEYDGTSYAGTEFIITLPLV